MMTSIKLLKCFCEARRTQSFYTTCLVNAETEEEKEFFGELVKVATRTSNEIKEFCEVLNKNEGTP